MAEKMTYQIASLAYKAGAGDVEALRELWEVLYPHKAFNQRRSIEDIAKDCADELTARFPAETKESKPTPVKTFAEVMDQAADLMEKLFGDLKTK